MDKKNSTNIYLAFQNWFIFFIILAGSLYLTWAISISFFAESSSVVTLSIELKEVSVQMFKILKPLIELVIIIWVSAFVLKKLGIYQFDNFLSFHWSPKNIFIISLLFVFIITSIVLTEATKYLNGVILLFIGIYIGSNHKLLEYLSNLKKIRSEKRANPFES